MRFRHVLVTMLNRLLGRRGGSSRSLELDDDWLRYRWELFSTYTVPSVLAQTEQDFTWVVLCNPDSPPWLRELTHRLRWLQNAHFSFTESDPVVRAISSDESADALLVTRIDSDDAWHRCAMERIRSDCEADPYTSEIVTFSDGYLLDHTVQRMRPYFAASSPFSTKINAGPPWNVLDLGGAHDRLRRRYPMRSISAGEPMFVVVTHARNYRGRQFDPTASELWLSNAETDKILRSNFGFGKRRPPPRTMPLAAITPRRDSRELTVVVSIPCYRSWMLLERAVESILMQTYRDLIVVVSSDGDPEPQWGVLDQIDDPRLVRFEHAANRGRYFADQVVLTARLGPYLLVQDADDWSEPDRVEVLLETLRGRHAVAAVSAHYHDLPDARAASTVVEAKLASAPITPIYLDGLNRPLRSSYYGLFGARDLLSVGGCYGGYRLGYHTFLMHLLRMAGRIADVEQPLYHHQARADSLNRGEPAGMRSAARRAVTNKLEAMYGEAYHTYCEYLRGAISAPALTAQLRALAWRHVPASHWAAMRDGADHLRSQVATAQERAVPSRRAR
jgi:hypothetical protein